MDSCNKINDRLYKWCQSKDSVSSLLAADPELTPADAWRKLFHDDDPGSGRHSQDGDGRSAGTAPTTDEELRRARMCGKWGSQEPSDLFLRLYHDALCAVGDDPESGVVSPCLMGSSGIMPLTIISVLPDIVRHMSNLIVRAEKEVFLATNFWQNSVASRYITNALRELSRRAQERGTRVVVKIIYDRGDPKQLFDPHHIVSEREYAGGAIGLPPAKDIPYVDLQTMNYHQPLLGTFHAKYMIVDRRIGIIQSNNVQDNDNLEMMVQVEGPIVDSLYDTALINWNKKFNPPLPCLHSPSASATEPTSFNASHANIFSPTGSIKGHSAIIDPEKMLPRNAYGAQAAVVHDGLADRADQGSSAEIIEKGVDIPGSPDDSPRIHKRPEQNAMASQDPSTIVDAVSSETQDSSGDSPAAPPWPEHTTDDPHYDDDLAGEVFRAQAAVSAKPAETAAQAVTRHLNHTVNAGYAGDDDGAARDPADEMTPYVPHPEHAPFPMALVNRPPRGRPTHGPAVAASPQNAAWLSALRNARRNVFIQTPTLNAGPLVPAIAAACERGVDVYCYVCLGYNDVGEMLPMQGGHNEKIAHELHAALSTPGRRHLHWHWYVAKDQTRPVVAAGESRRRRRSCHAKLLIADERVGVVGSGNQDTQSWFHSLEVNLLLDSPPVCRAWADALRRNQNTGRYGAVGRDDGVWRDAAGAEVEGAAGVDPGRLGGWLAGVAGAVRRLQGKGGF